MSNMPRYDRIAKAALVSLLLVCAPVQADPGWLSHKMAAADKAATHKTILDRAASAKAGQRITDQQNVHGLGLGFGILGASGFVYRHYLENWFVQANGLAIYTDGGNFMAFMAGIHAGVYLSVWQTSAQHQALPNTVALRLVGGTSYSLARNIPGDAEGDEVPQAIDIAVVNSPKRTTTAGSAAEQQPTVERESVASFECGIGFEVGSVMRPGISAALDILLTVSRRNEAFHSAMPMPHVALIYSW